jgi:hypothetical protein
MFPATPLPKSGSMKRWPNTKEELPESEGGPDLTSILILRNPVKSEISVHILIKSLTTLIIA